MHKTDKTYEFLKRYQGMKHVDNYIKAIWSAECTLLAKGMTREENKAYQIEKECRNEWLDGCKIADCVIATRETPEYFIKWKSKLSCCR